MSDLKFTQSADRWLCHQICNNAIALSWLNHRSPISRKIFGPDSMQAREDRFACSSQLLRVLPPQLLEFCQCHASGKLASRINPPEIPIFLSRLNMNKKIMRIQLHVPMNYRKGRE